MLPKIKLLTLQTYQTKTLGLNFFPYKNRPRRRKLNKFRASRTLSIKKELNVLYTSSKEGILKESSLTISTVNTRHVSFPSYLSWARDLNAGAAAKLKTEKITKWRKVDILWNVSVRSLKSTSFKRNVRQ